MKNEGRHKLLKSFVLQEDKRERKMRYVRIDEKTTILVPKNISDQEAKNEFNLKIEENRRKFESRKIFEL